MEDLTAYEALDKITEQLFSAGAKAYADGDKKKFIGNDECLEMIQHVLRENEEALKNAPSGLTKAKIPKKITVKWFKCPICAEIMKSAEFSGHLRNVHELDISTRGKSTLFDKNYVTLPPRSTEAPVFKDPETYTIENFHLALEKWQKENPEE